MLNYVGPPLPNLDEESYQDTNIGHRRKIIWGKLVVFLLYILNKIRGIGEYFAVEDFSYRGEESRKETMTKRMLYPIIINDWVDVIFLVAAFNKDQAKSLLSIKYPSTLLATDIVVGDHINFGQGTIIGIDPELNFIETNDDILLWLDPDYDSPNFCQQGTFLEKDIVDKEVIEEENDVKTEETSDIKWA